MKNKKSGLLQILLPWIVVAVIVSAAAYTLTGDIPVTQEKLTYSELINKVNEEKIEEVEIESDGIVTYISGEYTKDSKKVEFEAIVPCTSMELEKMIEMFTIEGANIKFVAAEETGIFTTLLVTILPQLAMIGVLLYFMSKATGGGNAKAMDFGNSRAKEEKNSTVRFSDVAGADEEKQELQEIVDFLKAPKKFVEMGARIPKGVLLVGSPGTGKTLLARAVSGEAGVPYYSISGSEFVEMFVGVGASRVRDMFKKAKQTAPCIIFIDEIDAVGRQRGAGLGGGHDEREQTLNQLLVEMDGFSANQGIIILAATNRADVLDPALLRPGRFDRQIQVARPDKKAREEILQVHARNKRFGTDVNFGNIARRTPGFSGAELENVLNEAALLAVRMGRNEIIMDDIDEAIDRVMGGPAKKSRKYTDRERNLVAYHEAGHAVIGIKLEDAHVVQKITIIPRGEAGGYNLMTPKEETYFQTKSELLATIAGFMGGRVTEEIFFGDVSTGAHNDIERATRIARMMVTQLGMSELGPIQYESNDNQVFLGRDYANNNKHSGEIAYQIDIQVRKIVEEAYEQARTIINDNKDLLQNIANALLDNETLAAEQIENIVKYGTINEPVVQEETRDVIENIEE